MNRNSIALLSALLLPLLAVSACSTLPTRDPLQITVAGIEPLQGQGLEVRMLVKLRVQNPNESDIEYDGAAVTVDVFDKAFASGVSAASGVVPRYGEAVVAVPITISAFRMARQLMGVLDGKRIDKVPYALKGKLSGGAFRTIRFNTSGELDVPGSKTPQPPRSKDGTSL